MDEDVFGRSAADFWEQSAMLTDDAGGIATILESDSARFFKCSSEDDIRRSYGALMLLRQLFQGAPQVVKTLKGASPSRMVDRFLVEACGEDSFFQHAFSLKGEAIDSETRKYLEATFEKFMQFEESDQ